MPPHGGHGHHGHHGHHHHGGGAIYAGHGGGYGYYPPTEVIVVTQTPACPETWAPVMATDGRIYRNACVAQKHGVGIVRAAKGSELAKQAVLGGLGRALGNGEISTGKIVAGLAIAAAATFAAFQLSNTSRDRRWLRRH